jgi:hypothetical protein
MSSEGSALGAPELRKTGPNQLQLQVEAIASEVE